MQKLQSQRRYDHSSAAFQSQRVGDGSWVSVTLQRGCLVGDLFGNVTFLIEVSRRLSQHHSRSERDHLVTIMLIAFSFVKLIIHTLSRQ